MVKKNWEVKKMIIRRQIKEKRCERVDEKWDNGVKGEVKKVKEEKYW